MAFSDAFARGYAIGDAARKRKATSKFFERFQELIKEPEPQAGIETVPGPAGPMAAIPTATGQATGAAATPETGGFSQVPPSLTRADINELDSLALAAAEASGDSEVYDALQRTTDRVLQARVLKYLGQAQTAAANQDTDATEKFLHMAYRYVPDGYGAQFERKDGKLLVNDPWGDGKVELTPERIGYLGVMIQDPTKWSEIVRQERAARGEAALKEREVKVRERGADIDERRVTLLGRELGIKEGELGLSERQQQLREVMAPIERFETFQRGLYYEALASQAKRTGGAKPPRPDQVMNAARQMSSEVDDQFKAYTKPPEDPVTGEPIENWEAPEDVAGLSAQQIQSANGLAQIIGVENLGAVSPGLAVQAGLEITRGLADPEHGQFTVDVANNIVSFNFNGVMTPVRIPASLAMKLAQQGVADERSPGGPPRAIPTGP